MGYVLGRARSSGQRVVLVYNAARRHAISRLIVGNCDDACTSIAYESLTDLAQRIDQTFKPSHA